MTDDSGELPRLRHEGCTCSDILGVPLFGTHGGVGLVGVATGRGGIFLGIILPRGLLVIRVA